MAPPFSTHPQRADEFNAIQKLGFLALLAFLYAFNSRVLDLGSIAFLRIPLFLGVISGVCALLGGGLLAACQTRVGICYLALTCYFAAGVPFAFWRGGSVGTLEFWLRTLVIWLFLVGLTVTYRECKLVLNTLVLAAMTVAVLGLNAPVDIEGRLSLQIGRLGNPNYFALSLLIALPFVWRLYWSGGRPGLLRRLLAAAAGGLMFVAFMKTGSRMGLYAIGVMILMVFLRANVIRKVQLAFVASLVFSIFFATLPSYLRERYFTFSGPEHAGYEASSAASSTMERQHLFRESVSITLEHPIFGVGLGNFSPYVYKLNQDTGKAKESWLGTHNTYTEMSSEAGIPALLIFLGIIVICWRSLTRLIRTTSDDTRPEVLDIHATAQATQVCLAAFCFSLAFIHIAYDILPAMVMGIAIIVSSTGERELKLLNALEPQPTLSGTTEVPLAYGTRIAPAMRV